MRLAAGSNVSHTPAARSHVSTPGAPHRSYSGHQKITSVQNWLECRRDGRNPAPNLAEPSWSTSNRASYGIVTARANGLAAL